MDDISEHHEAGGAAAAAMMAESKGRSPGRPRSEPTVPVHFRLPAGVYDDYARLAATLRVPVTELLREILTIHRPRKNATG